MSSLSSLANRLEILSGIRSSSRNDIDCLEVTSEAIEASLKLHTILKRLARIAGVDIPNITCHYNIMHMVNALESIADALTSGAPSKKYEDTLQSLLARLCNVAKKRTGKEVSVRDGNLEELVTGIEIATAAITGDSTTVTDPKNYEDTLQPLLARLCNVAKKRTGKEVSVRDGNLEELVTDIEIAAAAITGDGATISVTDHEDVLKRLLWRLRRIAEKRTGRSISVSDGSLEDVVTSMEIVSASIYDALEVHTASTIMKPVKVTSRPVDMNKAKDISEKPYTDTPRPVDTITAVNAKMTFLYPDNKANSEKSNTEKQRELDVKLKCIKDNDCSLTKASFENSDFMTPDQVKMLAFSMKNGRNCHLTTLDLTNCQIGTSSAIELADMIRYNDVLTHLYLESNDISGKGIIAMADSLEMNSALLELKLANQTSKPGVEAEKRFINALQMNTSLVKLTLDVEQSDSQSSIERILSRKAQSRKSDNGSKVLKRQSSAEAREIGRRNVRRASVAQEQAALIEQMLRTDDPQSTAADAAMAVSTSPITDVVRSSPPASSNKLLDTEGLTSAYNDIRNDSSPTNWVLLKYSGKTIFAEATGIKYSSFLSELRNDELAFAYLRIVSGDEMTKRAKFVFIAWMGEAVGPIKRAKASNHKIQIKDIMKQFAVELSTGDLSDISEAEVRKRVAIAGGANYGDGLSNAAKMKKSSSGEFVWS